ncbi:MAG TPA: hypothetical protein VGE86_01700 [Thermoanaerobaculia bacterium]
MRARLAALAILLASAAAGASELRPLAAPTIGPMRGIMSRASVAFGPDGGIAVWKVGFGAIWGTPLDRDGKPTAPARWILGETNGIDDPRVIYLDGEFALWWTGRFPHHARSARLDADLRPVDTRTLPLEINAPEAWNETLAIATTPPGSWGNEVSVHFVDRSLAAVRSDATADLGKIRTVQTLALADGTFALVTGGERGIFLVRYSAGGERLAPPKQIDSYTSVAAVATDGASILIAVAAAAAAGAPVELRTLLVDREDHVSFWTTLVSQSWTAMPGIEARWADGAYTLVVSAGWYGRTAIDDLDLYAIRLSSAGASLGGFVPVLQRPGLERPITVATSGSKHIVVFNQGGYGTEEILGIALDTTGSLFRADPSSVDARVSDTAATQEMAFAASDGLGWLAVWIERTATREAVRSVALQPDGTPASAATTLASLPFFYLGGANVAFNGIDYVVGWPEGGTLFVKRLRRDGTSLDAQPLAIATGLPYGAQPAMAAKGGLTLFAWNANGLVRGILLGADGRPSEPFTISPAPHEDGDVYVEYGVFLRSVSAGADGFLVGFVERRSAIFCFPGACGSTTEARAQLISREGSLRGSLLVFEEKVAWSAAAAEGTHLLTFDSGRASVIDEATATASPSFALTAGAATAFANGSEYVVASRPGVTLSVKRLAANGSLLRDEETGGLGYPVAISGSGALLTLTTRGLLEPPYFGSTALLGQVSDTFVPAQAGRRRLTRR